jgi:hypothetical protein
VKFLLTGLMGTVPWWGLSPQAGLRDVGDDPPPSRAYDATRNREDGTSLENLTPRTFRWELRPPLPAYTGDMGQSLKTSDGTAGQSGSYCLLVVASPSDSVVYGCFRAIAQRWRSSLLVERLWIEGDVPISSGFLLESPPPTISKLIASDVQMISRMSLEFAGLAVSYCRSGGHGPHIYRQSYFDEVLIQKADGSSMSAKDAREVIETLRRTLGVGSCMASGDFTAVTEELDLQTSGIPQKPLSL